MTSDARARSHSDDRGPLTEAVGIRFVHEIVQDTLYAIRRFGRDPLFTIAAMVTLTIGVGSTTAVMSVANAVLFRAPSIYRPDRTASIWELRQQDYAENIEGRLLPYVRYEQYRDAGKDVFQGLAAHRYQHFALRSDADAVPVDGFLTSGNYFSVLGVKPAIGQFYSDDDAASVVLSHRLWESEFGGDPKVVGRTVYIDSYSLLVVGVAPSGFLGTMVGFTGDLWIPLKAFSGLAKLKGPATYVVPIGRFRDGITPARARAEIDRLARTLPPEQAHVVIKGARLDPLGMRSDLAALVKEGMGILGVAAALVLLIAGANVAGMVLARARARDREMAVRVAVGATPSRLVRQLLTESVLLFLAGGLGGVLLAFLGTKLLLPSVHFPVSATLTLNATPSVRILTAGLALAAVTGILFGLTPALRSSRADVVTALKQTLGSGHRLGSRRSVFVIAQLAVGTVLLVTAGLFARSLQQLSRVHLGFQPADLVVGSLYLEAQGYDSIRSREFYRQLMSRVTAAPGVQAAGLSQFIPATGTASSGYATTQEGRADAPPPRIRTFTNVVGPGYFATLRIRRVAGRFFTPSDDRSSRLVAVVNETMADQLWPGESPLGKHFRLAGTEREVIGVAEDGVNAFVNEHPRAMAYLPFAQTYQPNMSLQIRSAEPMGRVVSEIRRILQAIDPNVALDAPRTMVQVIQANTFPQRFVADLSGAFSLLGVLLATLGVYALTSRSVAQRRREFGVRLAIGAQRTDLMGLIMRRGLSLALIGCGVGLVFALIVARLSASLLFDVKPFDLQAFAAAPTVLVLTALAGSFFPARRAARLPPRDALLQD